MREERGHRARLCSFGLLTLAVMVMIFLFSAQDGEDSRAMSSGFLSSLVGALLERLLPRLSDKGAGWDIRKYAHMGEYFCLGLSAFLFYAELFRWKKKGRAAVYALVTSFLYACSDEVHQIFVPERAGRFVDVLIDSVGTVSAIALACGISFLFGMKKR